VEIEKGEIEHGRLKTHTKLEAVSTSRVMVVLLGNETGGWRLSTGTETGMGMGIARVAIATREMRVASRSKQRSSCKARWPIISCLYLLLSLHHQLSKLFALFRGDRQEPSI
jgi:hypothetical protein